MITNTTRMPTTASELRETALANAMLGSSDASPAMITAVMASMNQASP
ncbi:MAG TPA: hypothetical protein VLR48_12030 [Thiocapsa sp.]|nr:hypothetical protein [Thiocapsa sp.]HSO83329.1 hypothetical protein [Thiocapsa sp.]